VTILQGIILGLVQGITEFLPLSSSGHLVIAQKLLGFVEAPVSFDIMVHGATLLSVLFYFRQKIFSLKLKEYVLLAIGTIPAGFAGIFLEPYLEFMFDSVPLLIAGFVVTGILMIATRSIKEGEKENTALKALGIGIWQAVAIFPSISRSGSTVFGALKSGLPTKEAFSFSFLLSIPAIAGAVAIHLLKNPTMQLSEGDWAGFGVALVTSFLSISILNRLMIGKKLHYFGYYCLALSAVLVFLPL
jgi:undecaprenyl-diphosphatase